MTTSQPGWPTTLLALLAITLGPAGAAEKEAQQNPTLKPLYSELRIVFTKYYPKATSHLLKDTIHFEQDTRIFIIHEPLKTGEWQDPWETRGPKRGGILCDVTLEKGPYQGQAILPQTFDKRYFKLAVMAPYSAKRDVHLNVHLRYPADVSSEFLKEFSALIEHFDQHLGA